MTEEQQPFVSPEELGESQAEDAAHDAAPGGPGGTGNAGYRRIVEEGDDAYHRKHQANVEDSDLPYILERSGGQPKAPEKVVSNAKFRQAVEGLQEERRRKRRQKKSA